MRTKQTIQHLAMLVGYCAYIPVEGELCGNFSRLFRLSVERPQKKAPVFLAMI